MCFKQVDSLNVFEVERKILSLLQQPKIRQLLLHTLNRLEQESATSPPLV
jgi:hypothetical protein